MVSYDDAWRLGVVRIDPSLATIVDRSRWNPPYYEVATEDLSMGGGRSDHTISSKAILFQDDNYFWYRDKIWSDSVRDVITVPMSAPRPVAPN